MDGNNKVEEDLTGRRFGRWTVLRAIDIQTKDGHGAEHSKRDYFCRCDCGTERIIPKYRLLSGRSRSCGCLKIENMRRPVCQYTQRGEFIQKWDSIKEAAKSLYVTASAINGCCSDRLKTSAGYVWRYADKAEQSGGTE